MAASETQTGSSGLTVEELLEREGFAIRPIRGDSMYPMLDERTDLVRLVPVREKLKKYDIPLFRTPNGTYILHRIVAERNGYYITRGDNRRSTERVRPEWILAVAEGYYQNGTYIPVTDPDYLRYVRRQCRFAFLRRRVIPPWKTEEEAARQQARKAAGEAKYGRFGYFIRRVFPPYRKMKARYPVVGKFPPLLPVFWIARLGGILLSRLLSRQGPTASSR